MVEITDWKTQTHFVVKGSELNAEVYLTCYILAEGAAAALRTTQPRAEMYAGMLENALRRFAAQHKLSTRFEVMMHSQDVIDYVITERMREQGLGFQPPF